MKILNEFPSWEDFVYRTDMDINSDEAHVVSGNSNLGRPTKKKDFKHKKSRPSFYKAKMCSIDERPNKAKRPRLDFDPAGSDPFDLDKLLGLNSTVAPVIPLPNSDRCSKETETNRDKEQGENERFDLNTQPERSDSSTADPENNLIGNDTTAVEKEISSTLDVGGKLGADLNGFDNMVREAVVEEGSQRGTL